MSPLTLTPPVVRCTSGDSLVQRLSEELDRLPTGSHYLISDVSWNGYEELLTQRDLHRRGAKVTFAQGKLELMTTTSIHERWKMLMDRLISAFADHAGITVDPTGQLTISRSDLGQGIEPDQSYYIQGAVDMVRDRPLDFNTDGVPDLAIEIEYSRTILDRLPIFAALGIPELWVYNGQALRVLQLSANGAYVESSQSKALPTMPLSLLAELLPQVTERDLPAITREFLSRLKG